MNVPNKAKGFTIIEVVLVLAIAGLIFLVVFLALPALQRGQRDTQRKQDLAKMMSQAVAYQSNNQGVLPNGVWNTTFKTSYLTNNAAFADPTSGTAYSILQQTTVSGTVKPAPGVGEIFVYPGLKCDSTTSNGLSGSTLDTTSRTFAAAIYEEQGGYYCQNN